MINILIDTNALIYFFDKKTDVKRMLDRGLNQPHSLFYPDVAVDELKRLKRNDVIRWAESTGLQLVNTGGLEGLNDDKILGLSKRHDFSLMTQDRVLRKRALQNGIEIIRLTGQSARVEKAPK